MVNSGITGGKQLTKGNCRILPKCNALAKTFVVRPLGAPLKALP